MTAVSDGKTGLGLEQSLSSAAAFLSPVLTREHLVQARGNSLIDSLISQVPNKNGAHKDPTAAVVNAALSHLRNIHDALIAASGLCEAGQILYNNKSRRTIDGLLDLISVEGIYPALSPGVGIPIERRVKSVFKAGVTARPVLGDINSRQDKDLDLLKEVVEDLSKIALSGNQGVNPALRERTLVDVVCACGDLAYKPSYGNGDENSISIYRHLFNQLLDQYVMPYWKNTFLHPIHRLVITPPSILYPILTAVLQPSCPQWLRAPLSTALSLLPLRPSGVRQTITFLANTISQPVTNTSRYNDLGDSPNTKSAFSLETLTQASRLLSAVPTALSPETYFTCLAPQLLDLLDNGPGDMSNAAAFVIGNGILGRRAYGAPGTIGWKLFAQPVLEKINPVSDITSTVTGMGGESNQPDLDSPIVDETDLQRALNRLTTLTLPHPNPGLTKRLIGHVMLPLWGLLCYAKRVEKFGWYDQATKLLGRYWEVAADTRQVSKLAEQLLWSGGSSWTYGPGIEGGIELRKRSNDEDGSQNIVEIMQDVDNHVREFVRLLESSLRDDQSIGDLFLSVSKRWLLESSTPKQDGLKLELGSNDEKDPLQTLVSAKLVQHMLEKFKDKLAANPDRILELVSQLLEEYVEKDQKSRSLAAERTLGPSLAGLHNIVEKEGSQARYTGRESPRLESENEEDPTEIISIALSLLSALLSSPGFARGQKSSTLLSSMSLPLAYIATPTTSIPSSLSMAATNLSSLFASEASVPMSSATQPAIDPHSEDRKTQSLAFTYLTDPLVPVRNQGLSLLSNLISSRSPVLDIPTTSVLLLSLLQDEDEFIYLNAIKSLSLLALKHPKTVVKILMARYVDQEEEMGLDQRLRLGEALLRTVEDLGEVVVGDIAKVVGQGLIDVAGRRGKRRKAEAEKHETAKQKKRKNEEAEEAWGGEVPSLGEDSEHDVVSEGIAKVVEGWEGKDAEEDVRIRTSALSVLGTAIETNVAGLGSTITSTAVDVAIAILTIESGDEKAILRRAAVLLILSLAKALEKARGEGRRLAFGFAGESLEEVIRVLHYIEATDRDDLVKGHTAALIESLDAWKSRSFLDASDIDVSSPSARIILGSEGLAGLSVTPNILSKSRPRVEEID